MFLFCDHLIWLTRVGIIRTDAAKWNELSNRYLALIRSD
jgi:hypothetical protein